MSGIRVEGNTSGNVAEVDANHNMQVNLPTTVAQAGFAQMVLDSSGNTLALGDDNRCKVSFEQVLFYSRPEGAAIDARFWNVFASTMTVTAASGQYTMNAGSSTTASAYAILSSSRVFLLLTEYPIYFQIRLRIVPQANSVIELGLGNVATTAAPTDGVFLRWTAAGQMQAVLNNNGTETATNLSGTLNTSDYYNIECRLQENQFVVHMETSDGSSVLLDQNVPIPATLGSPTGTVHLPFIVRVYNTATPPTTAPLVIVNAVNVQQTDLDMARPWPSQMAASGRGLHSSPLTPYAQSTNFANSTVPATASLSNTAASYATLGGKWLIANPTAAETDYALFAYQVPAGYQLVVSDIQISAVLSAIGGTAGTAYSGVLEWGISTEGSALSLATTDSFSAGSSGFTWAPRRYALGTQALAVRDSTAVLPGFAFSPILIYSLETPLVFNSGRYLVVILRVPVSAWVGGTSPTATIRGSVFVHGHFE
jgi:hypothetical protein